MHQDVAGTIAIYARFSTDRQHDSSIEHQVRRCREYIAQAGGNPEKAVVFSDFAVSGASLDRPGFESLMEAVKRRTVQAIVTEDLSRISRDFADSAVLFKRLQFAEVPLIGVADGINTSTKDAKLSFTLKSLVADIYLDDLRDKTLRGLEGRALSGYATGNTPYGYHTVPDLDAAGRILGHRIEIDDEEAAIVLRIFIEYLEGGSLSGIARKLNDDGILSPRARAQTKHKRKGWGASTIRAMLYNEKYAGTWVFKERQWIKMPGSNRRVPRYRDEDEVMRFERPDLRIIDANLWDEVQIRLSAMKRKYTKKSHERVIAGGKSKYLLSGILVCGKCSAPMTIHGSAYTKYYRCADNRTKGTCDNGRSIREDVLRKGILGKIREMLIDPSGVSYVRKQVAEQLGELSRKLEEDLRDRRARLARTEDKIRGLVDFIATGDRSEYVVSTLRDLETYAKSEKEVIERLAAQARAPIRLPSINEVTRLVFDLEGRLQQDPEVGRSELRTWLEGEQITLTPQPDGRCAVEWGILPLVILERASAAKKAPKKGRGPAQVRETSWPNLCSGDRI